MRSFPVMREGTYVSLAFDIPAVVFEWKGMTIQRFDGFND
jgi:hypothetical protein